MNNHNHNSKMMWWMIAGCLLLPILFIAISSDIGGFATGSNWSWLIFVFLFIGLHVGMLFHSHGSDKDEYHHQSVENNNEGK